MTIHERAHGEGADGGEGILAEGDLADVPGEHHHREHQQGDDHRVGVEPALEVGLEGGEQGHRRHHHGEADPATRRPAHARPRDVASPGRNTTARVMIASAKVLSSLSPAWLKNAFG